jgi:hypothetical protein
MKRNSDPALILFTWGLSLAVGIVFLGLVWRVVSFLFCLGYGC